MNFYTKVLSKFAATSGLKLTLRVEVAPAEGVSPQKVDETKVALRELGLKDSLEGSVPLGAPHAGEIHAPPLTFGRTPIEKLNRLGVHLGGKVELYAKREDCNSGLAFGGNKLRKLEYIIRDVIASNADTLVSIGGVQSNHTRMVAAVAAKIGMKCHLVQESWVPHEDAVYDCVGNIMLSRTAPIGATMINCASATGAPADDDGTKGD
jgi:hypothetical protein